MTKEAKIRTIRVIVIAGFIIATLVCVAMRVLLHRGYPDNTFLFDPRDRFHDETNLAHIRHDPYRSLAINGNLLPLFYLFLSAINVAGLRVGLAVYVTAFLVFFLAYAWRSLQGEGRPQALINCLVFSFLSYPFLFCLDRANPEMYEFMLLACFVGYYQQGAMLKANAALAVASNFKPFPLFFVMRDGPAAQRRAGVPEWAGLAGVAA